MTTGSNEPKERDERWMLVALVVLAVAYVVYRLSTREGVSLDLGEFGLDIRPALRRLGRGASFLGYLAPAAVAIFAHIFKRRRIESTRRELEETARREGLVRAESGVRARFATRKEKAKNYFKADIVLTRAALYVFDLGLSREPMVFSVHTSSPGLPAIREVSVVEGVSAGVSTIVVGLDDAESMTFRFQTSSGERWHSDILRAMGGGPSEPGRD